MLSHLAGSVNETGNRVAPVVPVPWAGGSFCNGMLGGK